MGRQGGSTIPTPYHLPTLPYTLYAMPLKGHRRTEHQKAQVAAMGKRRWLPKSKTRTKVTDPARRRLLSRARVEYNRVMKRLKNSEYNARRRERKAREELEEIREELEDSQVQIQEAVEATEERYESQLEDLKGEKEVLKKEVARLNAHVHREPAKIQHAVQKALKHGNDSAQLNVRYVKDKRGIVQDWARNTIVTLVNEGVPISKTWPVTKANAEALGVKIVESWSTRTSRRVVREGGVAAELMIANYVSSCVGMC